MKKKYPVLFILLFSGTILFIFLLMQPLEVGYLGNIAILFAKGEIAIEQRNLLFIIQIIMLLVVIPVYILTFLFSWRYRSSSKKSNYDPKWYDNKFAETLWWGIPCVLTAIVAGLTWVGTHKLDPYRPIESERESLEIQVVALQWKWLFIYPEQGLATVNFVKFPKERPVHFVITADAPMNSLWIPQLAGQIYAMPKMRTELYLIANEAGEYDGYSANLSGVGFAEMRFIATAMEDEAFDQWVKEAQKDSEKTLDFTAYKELALPTRSHPIMLFRVEDLTLFNQVIEQYLPPNTNIE